MRIKGHSIKLVPSFDILKDIGIIRVMAVTCHSIDTFPSMYYCIVLLLNMTS